jgi:hypothetical protein
LRDLWRGVREQILLWSAIVGIVAALGLIDDLHPVRDRALEIWEAGWPVAWLGGAVALLLVATCVYRARWLAALDDREAWHEERAVLEGRDAEPAADVARRLEQIVGGDRLADLRLDGADRSEAAGKAMLVLDVARRPGRFAAPDRERVRAALETASSRLIALLDGDEVAALELTSAAGDVDRLVTELRSLGHVRSNQAVSDAHGVGVG